MNILFFSRLFYPHIGGVEKHILEIGKRLVADGHSVIVVCESSSSDLQDSVEGIQIFHLDAGKHDWLKKFRIWGWLWFNRNFIQQADIIHCHDVFFWFLPFRFIYPTKPVYTTFHGYESFPIRQGAIIIRKISEWLSWGNICIGEFMTAWYKTKPTYISYGGVTIPTTVKPASISDAVFIGRLDDQTNIIQYAQGVERIRKEHPQFSFIIVGNGVYEEDVEKIGTVTGFQKDPLPYLYASKYAFISRYLGMLEAMVAKKLVFAMYDNPLKRDYLEMSPFSDYVVMVDSPEELEQKVNYFLSHPDEEKELVIQAYKWGKEQTWENVVNTYKALWKID